MESLMVISVFTLASLLAMSVLRRSLEFPDSLCFSLGKRSRVLFENVFAKKDTLDGTAIQQRVRSWSSRHETAQLLADLIDKDGAGVWPPRANHDYSTWPAALRGYPAVYHRLEHLLATATPSFDEQVNRDRIDGFRSEFRTQLRENVDLEQVRPWLKAGEEGRWDIFPRDTYNAFWCCVAMCRHAYRWGTMPVVAIAQLERELDLPVELVEPWEPLQRHFGCKSESGNLTSNVLHNFDAGGRYVYKANVALPHIMRSEENFMRIMVEVETKALPLYHDAILAILAFEERNTASCAVHMARIANNVEPLLTQYYNRLHDKNIARAHWLSYVQGIHAWGLNGVDPASGDMAKYNGLSGNQILAFQVLDTFIGLEPYLSTTDLERAMPLRQRKFCLAIERHSFRHRLGELGDGTTEDEKAIENAFSDIVRRLRMFRAAHRKRGHEYLLQLAPERVPMTAGKGVLKPTMDESMKILDKFMVGRLGQTI